MKPASSKAKGRKLQQIVRDSILKHFPHLEPDDVRSTSMGAPGADVLLSPAARKVFPYEVEAKNTQRLGTIFDYYAQATGHGKYEPLVVMKMNNKQPLAMVSLKHFMELVGGKAGIEKPVEPPEKKPED